MKAPTVSVIIPAYKCAKFVAETLESAVNQTFQDFEIIVINDGSPDTRDLECAVGAYRDFLVYIQQPNGGPSSARNAGIRAAQGAFIAFLDSDDIWHQNYLTRQVEELHARNLDLIFCDALLFGDSSLAGHTFMQTFPSDETVSMETLAAGRTNIITSCTLVRKHIVEKAGGFDEVFLRSEDYDLWLRIGLCGGRIGYHSEILARHRVHSDSQSAGLMSLVTDQIAVLRKFRVLSPSLSDVIDRNIVSLQIALNLEHAKEALIARHYSSARQHLQQAKSQLNQWKIRIALILVRICPPLIRFLFLARTK